MNWPKRRDLNFIQKGTGFFDYNLIAVIVLLTGFGLVMLYSTSSYVAQMKFGNDMYYFTKQAVISFCALMLALVLSFVDYHILWRLSGSFYAFTLVLIFMVVTPLGREYNGARRWLDLGVEFQPAELAKLAVIIFLPMVIIKMGKNFRGFKAPAFAFLVGLIPALETYIITSNLSTAVIILGITCVIIFLAHPKTWPFIAALAAVAASLFVFVMYIRNHALEGGTFRIRRIMVWLSPEKYPKDGGWQIMQALYALGSGGLFGKGLGNSVQKMGYVPEAQNDMIFSIVCEELGVFGGLIILILFGYMLYRLLFIAQNAKDAYGSLMVSGIFAHIMLQVIFNICVVTNLIPTTGITLPFISYGGTSIIFLMTEMSIALMVSRQIYVRREEKDLWGDVVRNIDY